jgi:DNA-binding GntR family transcriptional regulator
MNPADGSGAQQSISRKYLHDEVAGRLRALIQSGELKPQERLNEGRLAERFGISRTPLREAIKILATEGLLDLLPNRGARVAIISLSEIEEMAEVIAGLEATAGELACRVGTDDEIAGIIALHERMREAYVAEDVPTYFDYNRQIHEAIMSASHNSTLQSLYSTLSGRVQRARYTAHKTPGQWKKAMADHEQMVKLLRKRDGEALGRLLREHVRSKKAVIAATFTED